MTKNLDMTTQTFAQNTILIQSPFSVTVVLERGQVGGSLNLVPNSILMVLKDLRYNIQPMHYAAIPL